MKALNINLLIYLRWARFLGPGGAKEIKPITVTLSAQKGQVTNPQKGEQPMATRILTGLLVPKAGNRQSGSAVIVFNPFTSPRVFGDAVGAELATAGANGTFATAPGKVVSLRHIKVADKDTLLGGSQTDTININDGTPNPHHMTVSWNATGGSEIAEMSFLIVGEV